MSLLELGNKRFTIPPGDVALGSDPACAIQLVGPGVLPTHAVLTGQPDGQVVIRKSSPEAEVMINGVRLGAEPTPLLHGDKVLVSGQELTFVDERRSGSTQFIPAMSPAAAPPGAKGAGVGKATGTTGGRLVSQTDGREYTILGSTLVLGREAGCDVVVPGKDVSRRHAEIMASPKGYLLVDSSTNGVFVNDEQISGQRLLARGDVIRIGEETFRFYADAAEEGAPGPTPAPAPPPPPPGAEARLQNTSFGIPVTPRPGAVPSSGGGAPSNPGPLANFLVRTGALKGQRLVIRTPVANIGRADYNDLVVPDDSVSMSHAKLQRREGIWVLVDLDSTNGTFVDGERLKNDMPIAPGTLVRFGDVQLVFEPTDDAMGVAKGGGTKVLESLKVPPVPPPAAAAPPAPAPAATPAKPKPAAPPARKPAAGGPPKRGAAGQAPQPAKQGKGCGGSAAVIVLATAALVYWILV
jgi:pSer/pThr/pTyr-binding forkhead associated (FHA) protein